MKKIHVLPTDKPSKLFIDNDDKKLRLFKESIISKYCKNQNIYITSDEEIKEGDWFIALVDDSYDIYKAFEVLMNTVKENKYLQRKIILTTDQDLIKDGVQAIEDEFLEWFVKNPSCEEVEIRKEMYIPQSNGKISDGKITHEISLDPSQNTLPYYKIIIPKEESTQTLGVDFEFSIDDNGMCIEIPIPKQETLEEAAEQYYEDEVSINAFINGAKWQQERMYSEEEVKSMLIKCFIWTTSHTRTEHVINWFKQFKKK